MNSSLCTLNLLWHPIVTGCVTKPFFLARKELSGLTVTPRARRREVIQTLRCVSRGIGGAQAEYRQGVH